jgi:hypothetical protein
MEYNESVIELIKSLEGYRANAYKDMNGVLTIGYGHTNATGINTFEEDDNFSEEEAEKVLVDDLNEANRIVNNMVDNRNLTLTQEQHNLAVAVYFHRPWALQDGGLENIASGNIDLFNKDQEEKIIKRAEEEGYDPKGILNRLQKEVNYANEFDDPTEFGGNATDEKEPITIYMGDKPQLVDANIADLIVDNTDYTYEPVSEEAEIRKENRAKLAEKYPMDFEGTVSPMEKKVFPFVPGLSMLLIEKMVNKQRAEAGLSKVETDRKSFADRFNENFRSEVGPITQKIRDRLK